MSVRTTRAKGRNIQEAKTEGGVKKSIRIERERERENKAEENDDGDEDDKDENDENDDEDKDEDDDEDEEEEIHIITDHLRPKGCYCYGGHVLVQNSRRDNTQQDFQRNFGEQPENILRSENQIYNERS